MFRRQARKEEEAISEALLASIPEVDAPKDARKGRKTARFVEVSDGASPAPAPLPNLAHMRQELEAAFAREMSVVEQAVAGALRDMEARLVKAQDEIAILRMENEELGRARDAHAKRLEALRNLALREGHD